MSQQENVIVKWLVGISATLTGIFIIGIFSFWNLMTDFKATTIEQIKSANDRTIYLEEIHKKDVMNLREGILEMKVNQRDMLATQKEILKLIRR